MSVQNQTPAVAPRIQIDGDVLLTDEDFCNEVLAGASRRHAAHLDSKGLPFVILRGRKWRPLNAGRTWLAKQIRYKGDQPKRRAGGKK
jgi:hypothetical protein